MHKMKKTTPEYEWERGGNGGVTYAYIFKRNLILKQFESKMNRLRINSIKGN